jgi:hypothetical protein
LRVQTLGDIFRLEILSQKIMFCCTVQLAKEKSGLDCVKNVTK